MTIEDRIRNHMHAGPEAADAADVADIVKAGRRRQTRNRVGAAIAGGVLAIGAVMGSAQLLNDSSQLDVAGPETTVPTTIPEANLPEEVVPDEPPADFGQDSSEATTIPVGPFGPIDTIIGTEDGFVGLRSTEAGIIAISSSNGTDWDKTPTIGLDDAFVSNLITADDGTFVAVLELQPFDERAQNAIATSPDLIDWSVEELNFDLTQGNSGYLGQLAVTGDLVVGIMEVWPEPPDPMAAIVDLGLLTEEEMEESCGFDWNGPGTTLILLGCATETLIELNPGDVGYDEVTSVLLDGPSEEFSARIFSVTGPLGGPYVQTELDADIEWIQTLYASRDQVILIGGGNIGVTSYASRDGVEWTEVDLSFSPDFFEVVKAPDGALLTSRQEGTEIIVSRSVDGGATWVDTAAPLGISSSGGWSTIKAGAAGIAVLHSATDEDFSDEEFLEDSFLADLQPVVVVVDGFETSFDFAGERLVVTAPGGSIVHDVPWDQFDDMDALPGVYEFQGENDELLAILDPETGDTLFTITEEEFTAQMDEQMGDGSDEAFTEGPVDAAIPDFIQTLVFSSDDGATWQQLEMPDPIGQGSEYNLVAVGDDEVLLSRWDRAFRAAEFFRIAVG